MALESGANVVTGNRLDLSKLLAEMRLVQSLPFPSAARQVIWVSSVSGNNANSGDHPGAPMATVGGATGAALKSSITANDGVVIVAMEGHTETVATAGGMSFADAGVSLIGLGQGASRPTFTFNGLVTASMTVTGNSFFCQNCLYEGGIDALTGYIELDATDIWFKDCETRDSTRQDTDTIVAGGTTACDRLKIINHVHRGAAAAGADTAISIIGGDGITITNPWIDGNFAVAAIENVTTAATNLSLFGGANCYLRTRNAADVIFTAVATTTGAVVGPIAARLQDNAANITEAFVGADMNFYQPISISNADGEAGLNTNITASTDA